MNEHIERIKLLSKESKTIFDIIQKNGPITKNEVMDITGYKLTTLNRIMRPLEDLNLIMESGIGESSGGRKPILFDVNNGKYYVIGIDISRTYTQIVFTNLKMDILFKHQFEMTERFTPEKTVKKIGEIISGEIEKLNLKKEYILGAGVGVVSPLDIMHGMVLNPRHFVSRGWENVPIRNMIKDELKIPIFIDNGANNAVLAEKFFGVGKSIDNIAYFNCGIGIRTGVISSGILVRAVNNSEDAFGHMVVDVDGKKCYCGNYGCIECYSTILSIVNKYISSVKRGRPNLIKKEIEEINYIDICYAAEKADELSKEVIKSAATIFGVGLANYINLLNPRLIILSGPIVTHSNLFFEITKSVAEKRYCLKENCNIIFSKGGYFKDNAISIGGACFVVEKHFNY